MTPPAPNSKAGPTRGGTRPAPKGKIVLALVLLAAASAVLAWNFGLFGGGGGPKPLPALTPEAQAERDEAVRISKERHEQLEKDAQEGAGRGPG